ncbi:MAG TPA: efflux RND transporter periplasmic adaptor subunit [Terriglobales bacterium]|nr:efflux RND transporter periplasmic adaptor subunit [Terriglobales bacterium]
MNINKTVGILALSGLLLALSAGCKSAASNYVTDKITRGDIVTTVTATGTINPVKSVNVGSQISGQITTLFVDFNSPVKKGQLIALIDPSLTQAQVDQARANLGNAKANVDKALATEADAKRTWDRYKDLYARNLVAKSLMDASETAYLTGRASTAAARTQVDLSTAALKQAETNLIYTKIVSPVDGIVISRNVDVGQTVAASFQTPTLFVIAADLTKMQIDTTVDEADISNVKVGQDAEFTVDAYPDVTFRGTVFQVRNAATTVQNVVTYDVVVSVDNKDLRLMPGMMVEVSIITSVVRNVVRVPNAALRFRPTTAGSRPATTAARPAGAAQAGQNRPAAGTAAAPGQRGPAVYILENGKPRRVPVKIGMSDGSFAELLSSDLKEGQEVIIESLAKPGAASSGFRMF